MDRLPRVRESERVFEGRIFAVRSDQIEFGDGRSQLLDIVEHPGSFAILACPDAKSLVLVRQYRHPARAWLWEIPAGKAELGESPLEGATRELAEETGYRAASAREIASFYMTPGFCEERLHLVFAEGLTQGERHLDPDEEIEVRVVALGEAKAMAARGEIIDAKTLMAILWLAGERTQLFPRGG
ncbi:MAG: NUDIX hydrolase [Candidatus Eremiobacteraeota bacterium]|nr:NUDIX hydrolase [Candidatus Eremiobacteraeota bacterium]